MQARYQLEDRRNLKSLDLEAASQIDKYTNAFERASDALVQVEAGRNGLLGEFDLLKANFEAAMVALDFSVARTTLDQIRTISRGLYSLDPNAIVEELLVTVSTPLLEGNEANALRLKEDQISALDRIQPGLTGSETALLAVLSGWEERFSAYEARPTPARVFPASLGLSERFERKTLGDVRAALLAVTSERETDFGELTYEVSLVERAADELPLTSKIILFAGSISDGINVTRRNLSQLAFLDLEPISQRINQLALSKPDFDAKREAFQPISYPEISNYEQLPPVFAVIKYWRLGAIYISIQTLIDIGITFGLVIAISNLRKSNMA